MKVLLVDGVGNAVLHDVQDHATVFVLPGDRATFTRTRETFDSLPVFRQVSCGKPRIRQVYVHLAEAL
jgi:hypothetical protein